MHTIFFFWNDGYLDYSFFFISSSPLAFFLFCTLLFLTVSHSFPNSLSFPPSLFYSLAQHISFHLLLDPIPHLGELLFADRFHVLDRRGRFFRFVHFEY